METFPVENISTLSINVSEVIEEKNLHQFLRSSIENSNIIASSSTYYNFYYNADISTYEIIVFQKESNKIKIEPFLLLQKYYKSDDIVKVILTAGYFLVIKNDKILILKKMENSDKEEISLYLKQIYKIDKFEIIETTTESLKSLKKEETFSLVFPSYPLYPKKSFYYFLLFCIFSMGLLFILIYFDYEPKNDFSKTKTQSTIVTNTVTGKKTVKKVLNLFSYIQSQNIIIDKILYSNKKIKTVLYHNNKLQLLQFVNIYKSKLELKSLKYNETNKLYAMEISLEY